MALNVEQFTKKAREEAEALAKIFDQGGKIDISSAEAVGQLASLRDAYLSRSKELKDLMANAYMKLPDGRSIFMPELVTLGEIASESGKTTESLLEATVIEKSRVVCLPHRHFETKDLKYCAAFRKLTDLWLVEAVVEDLSPISKLTNLRDLWLGRTLVRDLRPLASLTTLEVLDVSNTQVEDVGPLAGLRSLHDLRLRGTRIDDLSVLKNLTSLERLSVPEFQKTPDNQEVLRVLESRKVVLW